jgi:hypothetical protein
MQTTRKITRHIIHIALADNSQLDSLKEHLVNNFGGYTLAEAFGGWFDNDGDILEEKSYIITLYDNEEYKIKLVCEMFTKLYNQTEIIYTSELITYNSITL